MYDMIWNYLCTFKFFILRSSWRWSVRISLVSGLFFGNWVVTYDVTLRYDKLLSVLSGSIFNMYVLTIAALVAWLSAILDTVVTVVIASFPNKSSIDDIFIYFENEEEQERRKIKKCAHYWIPANKKKNAVCYVIVIMK